ncbi:OLC1v1019704C1 [Oldenlandia corymbosa var. corymbosa]|uniref:Dirigent protein n=1 Tax=Oldenlandia corymbosa var. corymbosa TaxID=529605 RepID=A0AAV1EEP4_OLDCO|nr:OLC1v1019704C1 [Oldenlandia corymbosa var. corymbosa]
MAMRFLVIFLAISMIMAPLIHAIPDQTDEAADKWFKNLPNAKPKSKKLHFFIHDVAKAPTGQYPSIVPVAQANMTAHSPTQFGVVNVVDDLLTSGPSTSSKQVGYVEGVYVSSSQKTVSLLVALNFVFTEGKHNGSTLSVLGRIAEFSANREFPILGGSGDFKMAQGIAVANVHSADPKTGNRIVECKFRFLHY